MLKIAQSVMNKELENLVLLIFAPKLRHELNFFGALNREQTIIIPFLIHLRLEVILLYEFKYLPSTSMSMSLISFLSSSSSIFSSV